MYAEIMIDLQKGDIVTAWQKKSRPKAAEAEVSLGGISQR